MSVFGSRSNSIDSINNDFRLSDDKPGVDVSNNATLMSCKIKIKRGRERELCVSSSPVSSSPTPEKFLRRMTQQYGEYIVKIKHIKK
jgi:hypothetical protein